MNSPEVMFGRQEHSASGAKEPAVRDRGEEKRRRVGGGGKKESSLRCRPWEDLLWPRFENAQRDERLLGQRCGGGGDGGGPAAAARGPKASPRREGRPPLPLPPPSGFSAPNHSKIGERRFLTAFPGAPPVPPGFLAPRRCHPPLPSPAHGTLPVSEIWRRYPPASAGFLHVMDAGC